MNKKKIAKVTSIIFCIILIFVQTSGAINDKQTEINEFNSQNDNHLTDWWPMYQHDLGNTGFSLSEGPETNDTSWIFNTNTKITGMIVADDKIFINTAKTGISNSSPSGLYCLDLDGQIIWQYTTNIRLQSTPAWDEGKIYSCSDVGVIYCLDASNGSLLWSKKITNELLSSPIVAENNVLIASTDGNVYCVNKSTGERNWGTTIGIAMVSTPAVVNDSVFICNYCLDLNTGSIVWKSDVGIVLLSSPIYQNKKIYIGSRAEKLYCLNATAGNMDWKFYTGSMRYQYSPSSAYGNIYVGNAFGFIYCIDAETGEYIWSSKESARAVSSPAICDGKIYIGSADKNIYCLDAFTGENLWNFETNASIECSSVVSNNHVFIGSGNQLFCFGSKQQQKSNLACRGSFQWSNIKPGSAITDNISIINNGDLGSQLDWEIKSVPNWGNWTFEPSNGTDLTPMQGMINVTVTCIAPNERNKEFNGDIKIINLDESEDYEIIPVTLFTPKNKTYPNFNPWLLRLIQWIPSLQSLM